MAAKSRRSTADAMATVTLALLHDVDDRPGTVELRAALYGWAFNPGRQLDWAPPDVVALLAWTERNSVPITALAKSDVVRSALNACARTLDGRPAAATTLRRKRAVLNNALRYAVERELLDANPVHKIQWKATEVSKTVDRRVVANPAQVARLLDAVGRQGKRGPHLVAFFGCLYYGGMRPSEALALRIDCCHLPEHGWGRIDLEFSEPHAGADWTDSGEARDIRELKHRGESETRTVPIPPQLVSLLRRHVQIYGVGRHGRLFRSEPGGPLQSTAYGSVWRAARAAALTPDQVASPLARRPYDLRHAAVSLWLNAGVAATEVARRARHGVAVMLQVYANCVDGEVTTYNGRIERALAPPPSASPGLGHDRLGVAFGSSDVEPAGASRAGRPAEDGTR